jgi:hypothetical protein
VVTTRAIAPHTGRNHLRRGTELLVTPLST